MYVLPRLIISGLSGGAGKTMVSLGLARAFVRNGLQVRAFKKGPDYIDAAWLALAARAPQGNLDPFFSSGPELQQLFIKGATGFDLTLVEGNRGLFDGLDLAGSCSTAELTRLLKAPVLLVVDCTKMTRTAAALVAGCCRFESDVTVGGVILNRTGNERHQTLARRAVEELAGVPVLGVLPRRPEPLVVERHMGLAGTAECVDAEAHLDDLATFLADNVDLHRIRELAATAPPLAEPAAPSAERVVSFAVPALASAYQEPVPSAGPCSFFGGGSLSEKTLCSPAGTRPSARRPRIGYTRDAAFWFYYQENLSALVEAGAELVEVSLLHKTVWPSLDGLYLGGGLPELHAEALSANHTAREEVARLSRNGLPVYAECGGFMYLAEELIIKGQTYPMAGVFACSVEMCPRPQGLGYIEAEVVRQNPFHPLGHTFRGHEFHFSRCRPTKSETFEHILHLHRGKGMGLGPLSGYQKCPPDQEHLAEQKHLAKQEGLSGRGNFTEHSPKGHHAGSQGKPCPEGSQTPCRTTQADKQGGNQGYLDGLCTANTFAAYAHIYAPSLPHWAPTFVKLCRTGAGI